MIWERIQKTRKSGKTRTENGICRVHPRITVGLPVQFLMDPLPGTPGVIARLVLTSTVAEIHDEHGTIPAPGQP